jgi:uncharacterized DUF497 family protein
MEFSAVEWDEAKRRANLGKHKIDFADASLIFGDAGQLTFRSTYLGEERFISIGRLQHRLIAVVFTVRGTKIRIISARVARRNERKRYEEEKNNRAK